jgi:hypothetical protein
MVCIVVLCNCTELQPPGNCSYTVLCLAAGRKPGKGLPPSDKDRFLALYHQLMEVGRGGMGAYLSIRKGGGTKYLHI